MEGLAASLCFRFAGGVIFAGQAQLDVKTIVEQSVAANDKDFAAEPQFNYKEKDHVGKTTKTFQVTMIDGSPYRRLLAIGKPLSPAQAAVELKKEEKTAAARHAQTPEQRSRRIANYTRLWSMGFWWRRWNRARRSFIDFARRLYAGRPAHVEPVTVWLVRAATLCHLTKSDQYMLVK